MCSGRVITLQHALSTLHVYFTWPRLTIVSLDTTVPMGQDPFLANGLVSSLFSILFECFTVCEQIFPTVIYGHDITCTII